MILLLFSWFFFRQQSHAQDLGVPGVHAGEKVLSSAFSWTEKGAAGGLGCSQ